MTFIVGTSARHRPAGYRIGAQNGRKTCRQARIRRTGEGRGFRLSGVYGLCALFRRLLLVRLLGKVGVVQELILPVNEQHRQIPALQAVFQLMLHGGEVARIGGRECL